MKNSHKIAMSILLIAGLLAPVVVIAQKPLVDLKTPDQWASIYGNAVLTADGKYVYYQSEDPKNVQKYSLCFKAIDGDWNKHFSSSNNAQVEFSPDSKIGFFLNANDSLALLTLGTPKIKYISNVKSFTAPCEKNPGVVAYLLKGEKSQLVLFNTVTGSQQVFDHVEKSWFSPNGKILISLENNIDGLKSQDLMIMNLSTGRRQKIWHGQRAENMVIAPKGDQLAFTNNVDFKSTIKTTICYYKMGNYNAIDLMSSDSKDLDGDISLNSNSILSFSDDGLRLFINLIEIKHPIVKDPGVKVDIWSYNDFKPYEGQLAELKRNESRTYLSSINIKSKQLIRLEQKEDKIIFRENINNKYTLSYNIPNGDGYDWNWNKYSQYDFFLISTKTGEKQHIELNFDGPNNFRFISFSPEGRYVISYNAKKKSYFSYDTKYKTLVNISKNLPVIWTSLDAKDLPASSYYAIGVAGWTKKDNAVLIYDQHDIWQMDPSGLKMPINVTNGLGAKNNIVLRLAFPDNKGTIDNRRILLTAFNLNNKKNGFYDIYLGVNRDPRLLHMSDDLYFYRDLFLGREIIKARNANVFLVTKQNSFDSPNYFSTTDFKGFKEVSDIHPERNYNWLKSELITWKDFDNNIIQGILYKPENFDLKKKYPVIFYYYDKLSDRLHEFKNPEISEGTINIPYYVSNGYLVFTPDINFTLGKPGESALNSILSAANYLSKKPWIDSNKLAIQGHSFGGYETNYIVTHTSRFAAACSASGISDCINDYEILSHGGRVRQYFYENDQLRIGKTLWQDPQSYIENSPIFSADKVTTPLLLMSNKNDNVVNFNQGVELFNALRRLGKKVWLLQYDDGTHVVSDDSAVDFTIRMKQFFDHYLKGAAAPKWLLYGIPAERKGIEYGFSLDSTGGTPGPSKLLFHNN